MKQQKSDISPIAPVDGLLTRARRPQNLQKVGTGCGLITNAAFYIWHCDKYGLYSGYNQQESSTVGQTFLRGIQVSDNNGQVTFTTIFPGWYAGRITHIHT